MRTSRSSAEGKVTDQRGTLSAPDYMCIHHSGCRGALGCSRLQRAISGDLFNRGAAGAKCDPVTKSNSDSNSDPAASVHIDARALQSHAEQNARRTGLGPLAQRTHAISDPIPLERSDRQIRGARTEVRRRLEQPRGPAGSSIWGRAA